MSDIIKQLPDFVANQIAAGEVVNRPASVIKELVENGVDAGGSMITVNFRNGGKDLIQVIDNGCGMSFNDARLAFNKHATSKISSVDDIYNLNTFGFRGEALASIASVAEVEMKSRREEDELGTAVEISGGKFIDQKPVNCSVGTNFSVRNLFYNIPARKKFLNKESSEANAIIAEFQRVALCYPQIGFALYNNDSLLYDLKADQTLKQRIVGISGKNISGKLLEVKAQTSLVTISGYIGRPESSKKSNKEQFMFVNGRYFKSSYLHKAIVSAYDKLIQANEQPYYYLYLNVDPQRIDVNIHPQKIEVKFEDGTAIWQIVNAAIRESIAKSGAAPQMDFNMDSSLEIPVFSNHHSEVSFKEPSIRANPEFNPFEMYDKAPVPKQLKSLGDTTNDHSFITEEFMKEQGYHDSNRYEEIAQEKRYDDSIMEFIDGTYGAVEQDLIEHNATPKLGEIINISSRYIATTIDDSLVIIDLNRAYEAILYNKYLSTIGSNHVTSQKLLFSEHVSMSNDDFSALKECQHNFKELGFEFHEIDENTIDITALPAEFIGLSVESLFYDVLDGIREEMNNSENIRKEHTAALLAKIGAASSEKISPMQSNKQLVEQLMECQNYSYTPSGLMIMTQMTQQDIKLLFK